MQSPALAPAANSVFTPQDPYIAYQNLPKLGSFIAAMGGTAAAIMRGQGDKPDYLLIVSPDAGAAENIAFGNYGNRVEGADDHTDGKANTIALVNSGIAHPAAQFCHGLTIDGISDWYLPARHELRACYLNVPELFDTSDWYWSSTQYAGIHNYAWLQLFGNGTQFNLNKDYEGRCRAVRRLVIL